MKVIRMIKYLTDTPVEKEDQLIEEAKEVLYSRLKKPGPGFESPGDVRDYLRLQLAEQDREIFSCLFLGGRHHLIEYRELFLGTIKSCEVYPREIAKAALKLNAAAIILAHNHPSGDPEPSRADIEFTKGLIGILKELDIKVLDHFIVGGSSILSFAERGLI